MEHMTGFLTLIKSVAFPCLLVVALWQEAIASTLPMDHDASVAAKSTVQDAASESGVWNLEPALEESKIQMAQTSLAQPEGPVLLTISGAIANANDGGVAKLDREMLQSLGEHEVKTTTSWTDGVKTFKGVLARDVMELVGAYGTTITATALNDYVVEIPLSDFEKYDVLFALTMDGEQLTRRNKGPIWPVYPRDDFPELMNRSSDKKWIWQLVRMEIR